MEVFLLFVWWGCDARIRRSRLSVSCFTSDVFGWIAACLVRQTDGLAADQLAADRGAAGVRWRRRGLASLVLGVRQRLRDAYRMTLTPVLMLL